MKVTSVKTILYATVAIAFLSACTNNTANPNSGAQTGAVVGGLAGAAIGYNNSGHHSRGGSAVVGGLLGAAVGAGIGNAVDNNNPPPQNTGGWQ
jgi:outer membrane lipoprotein SlyB